jgi:hypothetical protein
MTAPSAVILQMRECNLKPPPAIQLVPLTARVRARKIRLSDAAVSSLMDFMTLPTNISKSKILISFGVILLMTVLAVVYWRGLKKEQKPSAPPVLYQLTRLVGEYAWLEGEWENQTDPRFRISISKDHFKKDVFFQVATAGDNEVPFPTACHYQMSGSVSIRNVTPGELENFKKTQHPTPQFALLFDTNTFELLDDKENGKACKTFIKRENTKKGIQFAIHGIKQNDQSFRDAWYAQEYKRKP